MIKKLYITMVCIFNTEYSFRRINSCLYHSIQWSHQLLLCILRDRTHDFVFNIFNIFIILYRSVPPNFIMISSLLFELKCPQMSKVILRKTLLKKFFFKSFLLGYGDISHSYLQTKL